MGGPNVLIEPFLAWYNVVNAIQEMNQAKARYAYRDGVNMAAGHRDYPIGTGKKHVDYADVETKVKNATGSSTPRSPPSTPRARGAPARSRSPAAATPIAATR